jgi:hypothetical protein
MAVSARALGVLAGILWLVLAFPLLVLPFVAVAAGSGQPIWLIALPFIALGLATVLITRPSVRPALAAPFGLGLLFVALAVLVSRQSGTFASNGPGLAYGAIAALTALISAAAWVATSPSDPSRR